MRVLRKVLIVLVAVATVPGGAGLQSLPALTRLCHASSLSYLSKEAIAGKAYAKESRLRPVSQVVEPVTLSGATIFQDDSAGNVIVAFRGSANPKNFVTNLRFNLVALAGHPTAKVVLPHACIRAWASWCTDGELRATGARGLPGGSTRLVGAAGT